MGAKQIRLPREQDEAEPKVVVVHSGCMKEIEMSEKQHKSFSKKVLPKTDLATAASNTEVPQESALGKRTHVEYEKSEIEWTQNLKEIIGGLS